MLCFGTVELSECDGLRRYSFFNLFTFVWRSLVFEVILLLTKVGIKLLNVIGFYGTLSIYGRSFTTNENF